eukprot:457839_1
MSESKSNDSKKAKKANKKKEFANLDLVMSGLKTDKEKTLAKYLRAQVKKNNETEGQMQKLSSKLKQSETKIQKLESTNKKARDKMYKEQKLRTGAISDQQRIKAAMAKIQKAVSARLKLLGIDFDSITSVGEALDASLRAINSLVAQLQEKDDLINKLEKNISSLKKTIESQKDKIGYLEKKLAQNKKIVDELKAKLKEKDDIIGLLEKENAELKEKNKKLEEDLAAVNAEFAQFKADTQQKFDEMAKKMLESQEEVVAKTSEIDELKAKISALEKENAAQKETISDQSARIEELEQMLRDKEQEMADQSKRIDELLAEIERLKARIAELEANEKENESTIAAQDARIKELEELLRARDEEIEELKRVKAQELEAKDSELDALREENKRLRAEIERLDALLNYPRETREIQTEISGAIDLQLNDYPRLLKEIVALKQLLQRKNQRIRDLEEENRLLMDDLQYLLKKSVAFYSDRSLHTGQVWNLHCSPIRYVVATGATDMTVRLWRVNPDADKSKGQRNCQVFKCARVDGKIDSLAWNKEGTLLAAGTGYRDGAEGFVCVWSMEEGGNQYMVQHAIRSRPTLRFGRCYAICFSPNSEFVYCGDTVGSVWCIHLKTERIVGLFQCHSDIVYDVCADPSGRSLYSVSLDQTIAVIVIPEECGGVKGSRDSYEPTKQLLGVEDEKQDYKSAPVKDIKRKSGKGKGKGKAKKKKKDKHLRGRSSGQPQGTSKEKREFSSMTLKELLEQEKDDEFKTYDAIQIYKDERYNFWRICVSADGNTLVTASRKIKIFEITAKDSIKEGPNVQDMDNDHVKSLNLRGAYLLTARQGCPRAKLFSLKDAKEFKTVKCKKAVAQSDFLCDDSYCVVLQQELIPNEAPRAPSMKLYQYNKEKKKSVRLEPETPRKDPDTGTPQ